MTKSMTSGNPAKLILLFALPLIAGNIFQQMYSMADTVIVGRTMDRVRKGVLQGIMYFWYMREKKDMHRSVFSFHLGHRRLSGSVN